MSNHSGEFRRLENNAIISKELKLSDGIVFDVSDNPAFAPQGCYHKYAGKDSSRALALSSNHIEDLRSDYIDLVIWRGPYSMNGLIIIREDTKLWERC
ncbi:uncharacterized protein BO97DRAFT_43746 [Aspergillus homomorphus CBS 101889]|uniref:Uncharacterized protein n=1 Tax=Aspergillus homomorphus (strain CBS 101889) TaxID=1450537 RepID=A0A395HZH0_ASPHC|nr:hypothetical protein BO97DRAFT_43746 [Aspergillus homomorphus CBS 101889]RAL13097.1 hypothetical protein BO97DRAFT_43746 [Aspergillus homomorphus CBS 101889]